jgi:TRAP transporter 4TM/12TM fusion protein
LLFIGKTPLFAAFYSIFATIALSYFKKDTRLSLKNYISIAENTAKSMIGVAAACASAGIVIGVVSLTGIGLTLGNNLVNLAGGNIILMLILTMLVSMVMGMGVPTTVVYILMATITAPPLVALGFEPLAAHMFVFYFALLASVTPPVAIAAYAGAGLAEASPSKTGWQAFRLAIAGFIIPYMFIFSPELLFINADISIIIPLATGLIGIVSLGAFFEGYLMRRLKNYERLILLVAALCLIVPETISDIVGLALFLVVVLLARKTASREKKGVL